MINYSLPASLPAPLKLRVEPSGAIQICLLLVYISSLPRPSPKNL